MTTTYGFDFARPRSRGARIARIDALATLLDTAFVIPGTGIRFGLDGLIGLFPVVGDMITTALSPAGNKTCNEGDDYVSMAILVKGKENGRKKHPE
jgi:hypothetical protein